MGTAVRYFKQQDEERDQAPRQWKKIPKVGRMRAKCIFQPILLGISRKLETVTPLARMSPHAMLQSGFIEMATT